MICDIRIKLEKERDEACRPEREAVKAGGRVGVTRDVMRRDTAGCEAAEKRLQEHMKTCNDCKACTSPKRD